MTERTKRRAYSLWVGVAVAVALACWGAVVLVGGWWPKTMSMDELKADLEKRVPRGSTWDEGEAWFASHRIKCFPIFSPTLGKDYAEKRGLKGFIPDDRPGDPGYIYIELSGSDGKVWGWLVERRAGSL